MNISIDTFAEEQDKLTAVESSTMIILFIIKSILTGPF